MQIVIYTDGSCLGNGKKDRESHIGVGVRMLLPNGQTIDRSEYCGEGTNQRAELYAVIVACQLVHSFCKEASIYPAEISLEIHTDSQYAIGCLASGTSWNPKANVDLIHRARTLLSDFATYNFSWVKGHAGTEGNESVDRLAVEASKTRLSRTLRPATTFSQTTVKSNTKSYLFSCGDSNAGPVGFCMRVTAASPKDALAIAKQALPTHIAVALDQLPPVFGLESLDIYFNEDNMYLTDIEEINEAST